MFEEFLIEKSFQMGLVNATPMSALGRCEAFSQPGQVLREIARMPDGRTHLWIARHISTRPLGFNAPGKSFAVALGCDISQAYRLVYAKGLDLQELGAATPIGTGCKVCQRGD